LAKSYLLWFIPGLLLQFPLVALGSALRATGIIKPTVGFQVLSVVLNMILAPLLIFGIGPWPKLGVTGAALATFISILVADVLMILYFERSYHYLRFRFAQFRPQTRIWNSLLRIGLPAGAEFILMSVYIIIVYSIIRGFGAAAQAGFGVGARIMQALFLPVVALSFAVAPVVGQNFGGRRGDRVRRSIYSAIGIGSAMMLLLTITAQFSSTAMIRAFSNDSAVIAFGSDYLKIVSVNFIAAGIAFTTSSAFQGIGNTLPPLISSMTRLVLFALPAILLSLRPGFAGDNGAVFDCAFEAHGGEDNRWRARVPISFSITMGAVGKNFNHGWTRIGLAAKRHKGHKNFLWRNRWAMNLEAPIQRAERRNRRAVAAIKFAFTGTSNDITYGL